MANVECFGFLRRSKMPNAETVPLQPIEHGETTDPSDPDETRLREQLPPEAEQRLKALVVTRRELEETFQPRKKHSYSFDVKFLTKDQDGVSTKPQQEEAVFIIRSFQDPPCLQFKAQSHSDNNRNCSMCGQTRDLHGSQSPQNDAPADDAAADAAAAAADAPPPDVKATDARHRPALTFGSVQIPRRFVGRPSSSTKEMYMSKYLKFYANEGATNQTGLGLIWSLMTDIWKFKVPSVVFSVTGGEIPDKYLDNMQTIASAIKKITSQAASERIQQFSVLHIDGVHAVAGG
jgi:hypothetical protein